MRFLKGAKPKLKQIFTDIPQVLHSYVAIFLILFFKINHFKINPF